MDDTKGTHNFSWNSLNIPMHIVQNWQRIVNLMAKIFDVPAGLIMRVHPPTIEVFLHSENRDIPYKIGETANLEGLYCNTVMETKKYWKYLTL